MEPKFFAFLMLTFGMISSTPACAAITGDLDGDRIVSEKELSDLILDHLDASPALSSHIELANLRAASHIHAYYPRTIAGSSGEEITIYEPVRRIVPLTSDGAEVIRSLGATNDVVGVGTGIAEDDFFYEFADTKTVGKWNNPDCEMILALDPDIVLAYSKWPGKDKLEDKIGETDITVVRLNFYTPETMTSDVQKLGVLLEREEKAQELADFYQHYMDLVGGRVSTLHEEKSVYIECYSDFKTVSIGSGGHQMCMMAGGRNIAGDLIGEYPKVDPEWVIAQNPDVVIKAVSRSYDDPDEPETILNGIIKRPGWDVMDAIENGQIHLLMADIYTGPRYIIGVVYMAQWIYPDLFADLDPAGIHQEYLRRFQGTEMQDKIFVYP